MKSLRLRYQIVLATFLPLVVFALLAGGVSAYALRRIPEDLLLRRQTALAQVAAAGLVGDLGGDVRLLQTTAGILADHTGDLAAEREILQEQSSTLGTFSGGTRLLDANGVGVAALPTTDRSVGQSFADQEYFQEVQTTGSPVFSTVFPDRSSGRRAIVIAVPVRQNGVFAGALVGELTLSHPDWARDLNLLRTPQGAQAYLIDRASTIIFHPDARRIGTSIQSDPELWRLVIAGQPQSIVRRPAGSPHQVVTTFVPIPGIAWGLIVEEPWDSVLSSIALYQWAASGLMGLGICLALVALVFSVSRVTRPLNALVAAAQHVATGRPYETLPLQGPPDLRTLIQVINRMVAHLAEQQATLRGYAMQVVRGQEDERLRLSRELHDETIQDLIALSQRIELCADVLEDDPAAARARLAEVRRLTDVILGEVRRISHNLRPFALEELGLAAALQVLARELQEQLPETHVHCEIVGRESRLAPELELAIFRIAQESLNNVRKHASSATRVNVALIFEEWGVLLMIEDDGGGFEMMEGAAARDGHLGLMGMAERAQLFGGELRISSTPGEGTTVSLHVRIGADVPT